MTVITQLSLCCGLYLAFNLGQPESQSQSHFIRSRITSIDDANGNGLDFYFISVQSEADAEAITDTALIMGKVIRAYDPKFVLNIATFDEDNPLFKNGTKNFQFLGVPWYTTTASKRKPVDFVKKIEFPLGKTLDIVAMDTGMLQDSLNMSRSVQLQQWLARILKAADSHWRVVIGLHPLEVCKSITDELNMQQIYESLHKIFLKYKVNAYLSRRGCTDYVLRDGIAYIGLPYPTGKGFHQILGNGRLTINESSGEVGDGFLLHRISSLEMDTYFVTLSGKVSHKVTFRQRGAEAV